MTKPLKAPQACIMFDGHDLFVIVGDVKIAKRGHPETPHAGHWISLEPGYAVYDNDDRSEMIVEFKKVRAQ